MRIKFDKHYSIYKPGRIIDVGGGVGDILIRRKFAHEVIQTKAKQQRKAKAKQ